MLEELERETHIDRRQLRNRALDGAIEKSRPYPTGPSPPEEKILANRRDVGQNDVDLSVLPVQILRQGAGMLGEATAKVEDGHRGSVSNSPDDGVFVEPCGFGIREHGQKMHMLVHLVGSHHFLCTVIRKHFEEIVAAAVELLESAPRVALGHGVPRLEVSSAAFLGRDAEPLSVPCDEVFLRARGFRDRMVCRPRSGERRGLSAFEDSVARSPKRQASFSMRYQVPL